MDVPIHLRIGRQRIADSSSSIRRLRDDSDSSSFNTMIQIQSIEEAESSTKSSGDGSYILSLTMAIIVGLFSMI